MFDLLSVPGLGRFLRWRHASTVMRLPVFLVAVVAIVHGLIGPRLAPKNLSIVLTWLHFRGLLIVGLLLVGNLFCMACPFILVRDLARRLIPPTRKWPSRWRNKWPSVILTVLILFAYELFDLWAEPVWTAVLILVYFGGAVVMGVLFERAPFCSHFCPLGQFSLVLSLVSPLEVQVRDPQTCTTCHTKDCLKGRNGQPGCELAILQQKKVGNMNCHWRLDCLRACPHDNVGILPRLPGSELWVDPVRSGIGRLSRRTDIAFLVLLLVFGALLNAFGMISPVYALQAWLADLLSTNSEALVLGILFVVGLGVIPALLLGLTAWLARWWADSQERLVSLVIRYAYGLVPLGFGVWTAHFLFHFLTGVLTIVPVMQSVLMDLEWLVLDMPRWDLGPIVPTPWLFPLEVGFMGLGWFGSLLTTYRIAERESPDRPWRAFLPWAGLLLLLLLTGVWLMSQPMEMRGTMFE
ncbi:MAG: 4Fe-4S binding protein [Chloroflexi bacterium]|nr:4Fe-4S binding protein [Chloroflexota bacterium]